MAAGYSLVVRGCRITNHSAYGIRLDGAGKLSAEDYNVFYGNTSGDVYGNWDIGLHSYGDETDHISDPSDDGYVDSSSPAFDFNVDEGSELRSEAVPLD